MISVPRGFSFAAVAAGFRYKNRPDLGLVVSDTPAASAALFTKNLFQAAPVQVAREQINSRPTARAVMINAGNANSCTGQTGLDNCRQSVSLAAKALGLDPADILPASTGVIGELMSMPVWEAAGPLLSETLGHSNILDFSRAIMTTDLYPKLAWRSLEAGGREVRVAGVAKGAGMICPNMATMLVVILTDAQLDTPNWRKILNNAVLGSFNHITVDSDTSTNDTVFGLANGASGLDLDRLPAGALEDMVSGVCQDLAYQIVEDGEGASKVMRIVVCGAADDAQAELAARAVGNSPLVKTAMFGRDANWGRIVAALGRSGARFEPDRVSVRVAGIDIFINGRPNQVKMDDALKVHLRRREIPIHIGLGAGPGRYSLLASDLTPDYVALNADYRS